MKLWNREDVQLHVNFPMSTLKKRKDTRVHGKVVKIEWIKERGITIEKVYVFQQRLFNLTGQFVEAFAELRVT